MKTTDIRIETGFDDNGVYCLFAITPKHEYRMALTDENITQAMEMLSDAVDDMARKERQMLADTNDYD